jgi:hypothetical protein
MKAICISKKLNSKSKKELTHYLNDLVIGKEYEVEKNLYGWLIVEGFPRHVFFEPENFAIKSDLCEVKMKKESEEAIIENLFLI